MNIKQVLILLTILLIYVILISVPIRFTVGDLGRHLKNGELIINNLAIPKTNLFTYTNTDFPFINHHWGFGVISYLINQTVGLTGLHVVFILLSLTTFLIFFHIAWRHSNFYLAALLSIYVLPLLASRPDIRPEVFSNLFSGIFLWILINYQRKKTSAKYLLFLPLIQFLWVNIHIYFFLGLALISAFVVETAVKFLFKKETINRLLILALTLFSSFLISFANPSGIDGTLYPLKIFNNYGFDIEENTRTLSFHNMTSYIPNVYFTLTLIIFFLSTLFTCLQIIRYHKPIPLANIITGILLTSLGLIAIRNFAIFGYFLLTINSINIWNLISQESHQIRDKLFIVSSVTLTTTLLMIYYIFFWSGNRIEVNINLAQEETEAADFFIKNNIQGPIFNDFDIGGYLVYYLYPNHQLFIDNRPEAVPASFFKNTYIPILKDDKKWQAALDKYHFNAIFFYRLNRTEPAIKFLLNRVNDPNWTIVFVNKYTIVFLKENDLNSKIIDKYQIPGDITLIYGSSFKTGSKEAIF